MNPESRLVFNYFMRRHNTRNFNSVLNLSRQPLDFPVQTTRYYHDNSTMLPFTRQSFDFVYGQEQMFKNPFALVNECLRLSKRGGMIQCSSPLATVLLNQKADYLIWPDPYSNLLCILPYLSDVFIQNRSKWMDLINFNPLLLTSFYHWDHPLELNIKLYNLNDLEQKEYVELVKDTLHQAASHTQQLIESTKD